MNVGTMNGAPEAWRVLSADRSEYNESEAREMAGCIVEGDVVVAYLPQHLKRADILAAAPELLAALEYIVEWKDGFDPEKARDLARAAIRKARGQA
jgi:hypothetical protein